MGLAAVGIAGAAVSAGTSIYGAVNSSNAASDASNATMSMYNQTRQDLLPYITGGTNALSSLNSLMTNPTSALSTLESYPGYQWALQEGTNALDRSAASKGLLLSGGQLKDVTSYGQGLASQTFQNYYNQLYGIASLGENAAAQSGNQGLSAVSQSNAYNIAGTNAVNSGITNTANSIFGTSGLLSSLLSYT